MNREIGGLQDMYSKNCGKSHTDTNHANAIRHCQHAGEQEGWEPRSCDFQVQRWMQTVLLEVHENIAATPCIGIASKSMQSTVFLVAVPRRDIKILSSHLREIRLPRILRHMRAKNPTKERSLLLLFFPPYSQQSPLQT